MSIVTMLFIGSCKEDEPAPPSSIGSFSPSSGIVGTTVTITGKNFSATAGEDMVKFNGTAATILSASASSISATVPLGATTGKISVTVNGNTTTSTADFTVIYLPTITTFSPTTGISGTAITITGTNFSTTLANNIVKFNNVIATISAATTTTLTAIVPENATTGNITVEVNGQTTTSPVNLTVLPTLIGFAPSVGAVGSEVIITGTGFDPLAANNTVTINNTNATVIAATSTSLTVQVPAGATTGLIKVVSGTTVLNSTTEYEVVVEVVKAGGTGYDNGYSITLDAAGNTYVTGSFTGSANFGSIELNSGTEEVFVAKYNQDMDLIWAKQVGGPGPDRGNSISADAGGNTYVTGAFSGTATFGSYQLVASGGFDMFLAKFNAVGDVVWAKTAGSASIDAEAGAAVKVDAAANVYVTGHFAATTTFGTTDLTSAGGTDIFITKYSASTGDVLWAKSAGGIENENGVGITVSDAGDVSVAGAFFGTAVFGSTSLTSSGSFDGFIAQYNSDGDILWVKQIAGQSNDLAYSVAVDAAGDSYVSGYFTGSANFGGATADAAGNEDIFVAKYDRISGNLLWVKTAGGSDYDNGLSIDVDISGNSYVTGYFTRTASFGDKSITSADNSRDIFVAKYNNSGDVQWVKRAGDLNNDSGSSISVDASGIIYTTGFFNNTATFGTTLLTSSGNDDIFVWEIHQ